MGMEWSQGPIEAANGSPEGGDNDHLLHHLLLPAAGLDQACPLPTRSLGPVVPWWWKVWSRRAGAVTVLLHPGRSSRSRRRSAGREVLCLVRFLEGT